MTGLQVGRLTVEVNDGGTSCGLHGVAIVDGRCSECDTPWPCPWCGTPTTVHRSSFSGTRGYVARGEYVGELCPDCTVESRLIDGEAQSYGSCRPC